MLNYFSRSAIESFPDCETLDDFLDAILPTIADQGEVFEPDKFTDIRWMEIRDQDDFQDAVLHIFCKNHHEYLISIEGNILKGIWRMLPVGTTLILEVGGRHELYDCRFCQSDFLILQKHGDQSRRGQSKYFLLGREEVVRDSDWKDAINVLYSRYSGNTSFMIVIAVIILILVIIIYFTMS